jgi:hypothetical protein
MIRKRTINIGNVLTTPIEEFMSIMITIDQEKNNNIGNVLTTSKEDEHHDHN